jgi:hypothetical protein
MLIDECGIPEFAGVCEIPGFSGVCVMPDDVEDGRDGVVLCDGGGGALFLL